MRQDAEGWVPRTRLTCPDINAGKQEVHAPLLLSSESCLRYIFSYIAQTEHAISRLPFRRREAISAPFPCGCPAAPGRF